MNIAETPGKSKAFLSRIPRDMLILAVLVLSATLSFGLGYMAGLDAGQEGIGALTPVDPSAPGAVVASKSGMKYYLPSCAGAERISDENKVWFSSSRAASAAGYSPAANCDGL